MPFIGSQPAETALTTGNLADDIVTEAKMANDAIGLAELKAGTDGEIISWDASGNPVAIGAGSSGEFLKSQGAGSVPVFAAVGGLEYVTTLTADDSAGALVYESMASGYDYEFVVQDLVVETDGAFFRSQLGVAGPTYRTSNYRSILQRFESDGLSAVAGSDSTSYISYTDANDIGGAANEDLASATIALFDPANASFFTSWNGSTTHFDSGGHLCVPRFAGKYTTAEAHTSIKFLLSTGKMTSGRIAIWRKARS